MGGPAEQQRRRVGVGDHAQLLLAVQPGAVHEVDQLVAAEGTRPPWRGTRRPARRSARRGQSSGCRLRSAAFSDSLAWGRRRCPASVVLIAAEAENFAVPFKIT